MNLSNKRFLSLTVCTVFLTSLTFTSAVSADGSGHGHGHNVNIGKPAKAANAERTIDITMGDIYFEPKKLSVEGGETVRFVVKNVGKLIHEFNIGTSDMHKAHRNEMAEMMKTGALTATGMDHSKMDHSGMKHDDPNSVLVEPGKTMELTWTFPKSGELQFACNVPGHTEAGMVGHLAVGHSH